MKPGNLINSENGIRLAFMLGRLLPLRLGYFLARIVADRIVSNPHNPEVQAVRANQQGLEKGRLSPAALDQRVRAVFRNAARSQFELYHYLGNLPAMSRMIALDDAIRQRIQSIQSGQQGIVIACPHTGNFEVAGRALVVMGLRALLLSPPNPRGDYRIQNRLRRQAGLEITPISIDSLRIALRRLQQGGSVLTGVDWPVAEPRFRPLFCGRPSLLPTGHVRLAMKAGVPLGVVACLRRSDGIYQLIASETLPIQSYRDPAQTILRNAEAALEVAESFIRRDPEQWMMFHRVWEEDL
ncbi:MAG: hypothetical protein JW726_19375 [Anaerolineales bacterium]|nr:hypothetical protein [Anaerolineales bacterium]